MRRVLDGCMYDTATSEYLACVASADNTPADEAWQETLYRKGNGQYWLYCEGGRFTVYSALNRCNIFDGSWCIRVLSEDDARAWCEDNLDGDAYEAIWGPVSEDLICAAPRGQADIKQAIRDTWIRTAFAARKFDRTFISTFLDDYSDSADFDVVDDL